MESPKNKKVIVAMSGGVDSSVAAALLKKAWFLPAGRRVDVIGVFMKLYDSPRFKKSKKQANKIAKSLNIPFLILDLRAEFKKKIINSFLKEYKLGLTPNPCVVCNKEIKFKFLIKKAQALKADYVATGHYVKVIKSNSIFKLLRAKDREKDQSYFLWQLSQKHLRKALFPLGGLTKSHVKNLAKKFKLPVLNVPESQEICFIQTTVNNFLNRHLKQSLGRIIDKKGKTIGQHQGLAFYTIGQRKGIRLPGGPYFVLAKDLKKNILVVTKDKKDLLKKELMVKKVNWIRAPSVQCDKRSVLDRAQKVCALVSGKKLKLPLKVRVKIRYRSNFALADIKLIKKGTIKVIFNKSQRAITPGQSAVFYRGKELLGGGIIS